MLVRVKRVLTLGSSYFVKLLFPRRILVVEARVVRVQTAAEDFLTGMEFLKLCAPSFLPMTGRFFEASQTPSRKSPDRIFLF